MTNSQRLIKKIIIVLIFLSSIAIISRILFPPSVDFCFNGILDYGEEKVDCGGVCQKKCPLPSIPPKVSQIQVEWAKAINDGDDNYDLVAKVKNDNELWGIFSVSYSFLITQENGEILKTPKGETYIMPKGFLKEDAYKYIFEDNFKLSSNISKIEIELSEHNWSEIKDPRDLPHFNSKVIEINDKKGDYIKDGSGFYYVFGITKNTSKYEFRRVDITVVIYNKNNDPIAVGRTDQWTLSGGEKREFRSFWEEEFEDEIGYIDYIAQTNVFDSENFMNDFGTGEKFINI